LGSQLVSQLVSLIVNSLKDWHL